MIAKLYRRFFPAKVLLSDYEALQAKLTETTDCLRTASRQRTDAQNNMREERYMRREAEVAVRRMAKQRDEALRGFSPLLPLQARIEDEPSLSPVAFATLSVRFPMLRLAVAPEVLKNSRIPTIDIARAWAEAQVPHITDAFAVAIKEARA